MSSFSVNGVAALHTQLLKQGLFNEFCQLWPKKFNNKTNGVTPRRWLAHCNQPLSNLITSKIGSGWIADLSNINKLTTVAKNKSFQKQWRESKLTNKHALIKLRLLQHHL